MNAPRVAMLTHSTLPRGGVVHAMSLCEALTTLGAEAVLHAPDASAGGFFRKVTCETCAFPVTPVTRGLAETVEARISDYVAWFRRAEKRGFDIYHAHDGLSGAALARLKRAGLVQSFVRTVHHLDVFADPRLNAWQAQSIDEADALMTVSDVWRRRLLKDFGRDAAISGNGVDLARFSAAQDGREPTLRARWALGAGPVLLAVGGVEARKNTLNMLVAFDRLQQDLPTARFVIAGGASLLNHEDYQREFRAALAAMGARAESVVVTGPLADADMPALYRIADALAFASVNEGFGLCVLEAMACGVPVVVSRLAPFTEYLGERDAFFCDPDDADSIAAALARALRPESSSRLRGREIAAHHSWGAVAERTLRCYQNLTSLAYA